MIKSSLLGLAFATAVQTTTPELEKNEYVRAIEESTKQTVVEIIRDDYALIAEKLERLEEFSGKACELFNPQTRKFGDTKLVTASYNCKVSGGGTANFHVGQTIGPEKKISKNESCVDLGLYFGNDAGQLQFGTGTGVTVKNKKGTQDIFYTNISCGQLAEQKGLKNLK